MAATIKKYPLKTDFSDESLTNVGSVALDEITSDSDTSVTVTLGTDAGDDFIVATDALVVEGDGSKKVGIGTATPSRKMDIVDASDPQLRLTQATGFMAAHVDVKATTAGELDITSTSLGFETGTVQLSPVGLTFSKEQNGTVSVADTAHDAPGKALSFIAGNPTAGTTADIAGGDLTLAGGQSKGSGTGGDVIVQTSAAAGSGTGLNNLTTKMIVKEDGDVGIGTASPASRLDIQHSTNGTGLTLNSSSANSRIRFNGSGATDGTSIGTSNDDFIVNNEDAAGKILFQIDDVTGLTVEKDGSARNVVAAANLSVAAQGDIRFEDSAGGEYVGFQAPGTVASSHTYTWPDALPGSDKILQSDSSGTLTWETAAAGGGLTVTAVSFAVDGATYSATTYDTMYIVTTTGGAVEIDLPTAASQAGKTIDVLAKTGATNTVTVDPNGSETINGSATSRTLTGTDYQNLTLVSDGSNWVIR